MHRWVSSLRIIIISILVICTGNFSHCQSKTLEFIESIEEDSIYLDLKNYMHGPVLMKLTYKSEVKDHIRGPDILVIGAVECIPGLISIPKSIIKDTAQFEWKDLLEVGATLGDPSNSSHNDSIFYNLPFKEGQSYKILQSWNGKFSHRSKESKYALDFTMPEGDTICAAREGIVIRTTDHFTESGGKSFKDKANQIVILHEDGTMAFYVHLLHKGVLVQPGDTVTTSQVIGLSGNTGYSTKPHLHFVVREAPDKSVPVYFYGYEGVFLKKGRRVSIKN